MQRKKEGKVETSLALCRLASKTYQALGVLTDDDTVDELVVVLGATHTDDGTNVGIEVELLPQLDDG